jgi:hypothetical protein
VIRRVASVYRHHLEYDFSMLTQQFLKPMLILPVGHGHEVHFVHSMIRTIGPIITIRGHIFLPEPMGSGRWAASNEWLMLLNAAANDPTLRHWVPPKQTHAGEGFGSKAVLHISALLAHRSGTRPDGSA